MHKTITFLITISLHLLLFGQDSKLELTENHNNISFDELVEKVETSSNYKIYYKKEWTSDIKFNLEKEKPLFDQLNKQLVIKGLQLYFENNNVYLIKGNFITQLPQYHSNGIAKKINHDEQNITDVEKSYLQSKIIASSEVLYIGNKNEVVNGKTCVISGKIRDEASGEPLVGATVYIEEQKVGSATDVDGNFKLALKPGKHKVLINHMSMKQQEYYFQVYTSGSLVLEMGKELIEIHEVVVSANRNDNVKGMQMGYERVTAKAMKEIPVVMGEKDVLKVATMLPGVENVGEGSSGFNVRGGSADQNMFYINKIPVYNTSHLFGFFTSFSPDIVNDFTLYKSNIPAKYGGRLSSIFDITTRQGNKKKFFGQGGISPVTSHMSIEGPLIKDKTSVVASWRSTYSDWLLNRIKAFDIKESNAFFYDATLSINTEINNKNLVKVFGYQSEDRFALSSKNDYHYSNTGGSVSWKHLFPSSITGDFSAVYSKYLFDNIEKSNLSEAYSHLYTIENIETKADFSYVNPKNHQILFGIGTTLHKINRGDILPYGDESFRMPVYLGIEKGLEGALYISDEFQLLPRVTVLAGLRYSFFAELGPKDEYEYFNGPKDINNIRAVHERKKGEIIQFYHHPEFRAALNYSMAPNTSLKASYNRLKQYIFMLSNTVAISPNDQWKLVSSNIKPPTCDQVSLGWYQNLSNNNIESSVEVYRKWIDEIVEYKDGADFISQDPIETQILQGQQNSKGVEFMIKKKNGKFTGWLSYTYSRSVVQVNGNSVEERINHGKEYPSNFDRPHSLNIVSNKRFNRRLSLSTNFVYSTGRPVTYPIAAYYSEGQQLLHFSDRNKYRLPDYIRMDLSINLEGNLRERKIAHSFWMINFYNALGRANAYSVYYEAIEGNLQAYKLSVFARPIITISWNYKFGNYLSD